MGYLLRGVPRIIEAYPVTGGHLIGELKNLAFSKKSLVTYPKIVLGLGSSIVLSGRFLPNSVRVLEDNKQS